MVSSGSESYAKAGVDITAGYKAVELIKKHVARTVLNGDKNIIGGFGGLFPLELDGIKKPVLVAGTDGVGTKLKLAFVMNRHNTVGIDCVAMCVNDVICCGAKPLMFLDYIACGKNRPEQIEQIVSGVADGCVEAGCELVGGETAEMPGFYKDNEYDLAGFCVGVVDKDKIIDNKTVDDSDIMLALPSSGVHSNGFSLVRKIFDIDNVDFSDHSACENKKDLLNSLLTPTKIYVKPVLRLSERIKVKGIAHITGGGFYENIPRCLPDGFGVKIKVSDVRIPQVFKKIQKHGDITDHDMFNTFNMGVGMTVTVARSDVKKAIEILQDNGVDAYVLGNIMKCKEKIIICEQE